jgi:hypothetical protein
MLSVRELKAVFSDPCFEFKAAKPTATKSRLVLLIERALSQIATFLLPELLE